MNKKKVCLFSIFGSVLAAATTLAVVAFTPKTASNNDAGIDIFNESQPTRLNSLNITGVNEIEDSFVSEAFVHTSEKDDCKFLRFAVAVETVNIDKITLTRKVDGSSKNFDIRTVYKTITVDGLNYFYDDDSKTLTTNDPLNDYYFACYVAEISSGSEELNVELNAAVDYKTYVSSQTVTNISTIANYTAVETGNPFTVQFLGAENEKILNVLTTTGQSVNAPTYTHADFKGWYIGDNPWVSGSPVESSCIIDARLNSTCIHRGTHFNEYGNFDNSSRPLNLGVGIREFYECEKCHEIILASSTTPQGMWETRDLTDNEANTIAENQDDIRYTAACAADFLNLNLDLKMSCTDGEVANAVGQGKIAFDGAYFDTDTFFANYTHLAFDVKFDGAYTDNLIYTTGASQWFRTDGVANSFDNNFFRVYKNGVQTQIISPNTWYTISMLVRADDGQNPFSLKNIYLDLYNVDHSIHLKNLRFGTSWMGEIKANPLGFIAGDGLVKEMRKTVGGDDIVFMHGNGTFYFEDVQDASGNCGIFFDSDYSYVVFDVYCTYHDAPHAYVPYEDCWMHPTNDWSWSPEARDPELVTSYQNGQLVNKFNVNNWYTFCLEIYHDRSLPVRFELGATGVYLTNLRFTTAPDCGTVKTANDMPTYDSLGFYSTSSNATLTRTTFEEFDVVEVTTTGKAAIYIPDLGVHTSMTDKSTKGVGGICSSGYSFVSFDVYVKSGNDYYLTSPWRAIWHNAQGYREADDYFVFYDTNGNVSSGGIASYGNWYTIKCQLNNAQGNDWCFNWGVNDEAGSHLYLKNIVFYS